MAQHSPPSEKGCNKKTEYKQKEIRNGKILTGAARSSYSTPTRVVA